MEIAKLIGISAAGTVLGLLLLILVMYLLGRKQAAGGGCGCGCGGKCGGGVQSSSTDYLIDNLPVLG